MLPSDKILPDKKGLDMSALFSAEKVHKRHLEKEEKLRGSYPTAGYEVSVQFCNELTTSFAVEEVASLQNPQILIWYIGCNGLKKNGVSFYKDSLIFPIMHQAINPTFWLVDLTAWAALKNSACAIDGSSHFCDEIERIGDCHLKCIRTSLIFKKMQGEIGFEISKYLKKAIKRNFILANSASFSKNDILIKDVFKDCPPVLDDLLNFSTNEAYSSLQYLEGCLLIEEVILNCTGKSSPSNLTDEIQIVFLLPNDEIKYYQDSEFSFEKDLRFFLSRKLPFLSTRKLEIKVKMIPFTYGEQKADRPYNGTGEILKRDKLSYEEIAGNKPFKNEGTGVKP